MSGVIKGECNRHRDEIVVRQHTIARVVEPQHIRRGKGIRKLNVDPLRPILKEPPAVRITRVSQEKGNVPFLLVLETNRQLLDTFGREAQLHADLRRAWAELERAVGRRLVPPKEPVR